MTRHPVTGRHSEPAWGRMTTLQETGRNPEPVTPSPIRWRWNTVPTDPREEAQLLGVTSEPRQLGNGLKPDLAQHIALALRGSLEQVA